ncbi:SHOCT domain-containing protein [Halogeometricum limi]|uniref:Short C-terminal domain-containing protein n=1 Tax=Halogeometricum limi TaxID=555875 RepID=A0A1I6G4F2_9EURY|nr:SHOCT domain-containing protein [Halogeometricum limi]SFR37093.1 Short C-terminal domain-containing protein [Halogeometricum limi]
MATHGGRASREERRESDEETPLQEVVAGVVIGAILLVGFALLAVGYPFFWVVFPVGFAGVLPMAIGLTRLYERRREAEAKRREAERSEPGSALETLRRRYATGEIDEDEFERRVERLLGTETASDAAAYVRTRPERERETE